MTHDELLHMAKIFTDPNCDYSDVDLPVELLTFAEGYLALAAQLEDKEREREYWCELYQQERGLRDGLKP